MAFEAQGGQPWRGQRTGESRTGVRPDASRGPMAVITTGSATV